MPAQCPECGRFLKKDLVESLAAGPAPCPKCETELTAAMFDEAGGASEPAADRPAADVETTVLTAHTPEEVEAAAAATSEGATSGTPSGTSSGTVATEAPDRDPLDGWDQGSEGLIGLGGQHEHELRVALEPQQALVAGVVGALVGALVSRRSGRGAVLGAMLAILAGAIARAMGESRELR